MNRDKKRKLLWICIGVIAALYFARSIIISARQAADYQRAVLAAQQKAIAARTAAASTAAPAAPTAPPVTNGFLGHWQGYALLPPSRGGCTLALEIENQGKPGEVSGFASLSCSAPPPKMGDGHKADPLTAMMQASGLDPASAIMTGTADNASLQFKVTHTVGVERSVANCPMTSATATPFGINRIAFEWKEDGDCGGGQMLLTKR